MSEMLFVPKDQVKVTRWLHAGTSKDQSRPSLAVLKVEEDVTVTADGHQMRIVPTPECFKEQAGKMLRIEKAPRVGGDAVTFEEYEGNYPEWRSILPTSEPIHSVDVNPVLLAGILKEMSTENTRVRLEFHGGAATPIVIRTPDNVIDARYALLMPMHGGEDYYNPLAEATSD